ncbi:MAG TPA: SDR family oxidoreductase [Roseiarcus sp.]|jgi:NAD(P)-dependent dehydrogenase (short-subunit alcohol dehydrogenase family)|nr:SDR family oxidoreductase [Roseiarcus sp.]
MAVLITGGTKGIGFAIAKRFARPGVDIFLAYLSDDASAAAACREIEALGASPRAIKADVGSPEGARSLLSKVAAKADRLDLLVHCAVKVLVGSILDADPVQFTRAITLNGTSLVFIVQAARPLLKRGSSVIFLSSRGSRQIVPGYGAIGAGKALAEALVRYLVPELAPLGVRINCVAPGTLDTEAVRNLFGEETDSFLASEAAGNPSGRNIAHDDYTGLVAFLASAEASMIQGQVVSVNGGQYVIA